MEKCLNCEDGCVVLSYFSTYRIIDTEKAEKIIKELKMKVCRAKLVK